MKKVGDHFGVLGVTVGARSGSMKDRNVRMLELTILSDVQKRRGVTVE